LIALVVIVVIVIGVLVFVRLHNNDTNIKVNNSPRYGIGPSKAATGDTPFGQAAVGSGVAEGISVHVDGVISEPQTSGDAPNAGMQYLEIDIGAHNSNKYQLIIPGTFMYRTAAGQLLNTADSIGKGNAFPGKNIQLDGKQAAADLLLNPGQTAGPAYVVYQVPANETGGKLIWFDGFYDPNSTKLAIFDLK
jgi:hypothetical protein